MRAAAAAGALACVVLALCGCGSSSSNPGTSTATGAGSSGSGSSGSGGSGSGGTGGTGGSHTSSSAASIHIDTTPQFASPPAGAPVRSGLVQIAYRDIAIFPDAIRVKTGTTVRWTNYDQIDHDVTSLSGPQTLHSGSFGPGASYQVTLSRPGVIHYVSTGEPTTMNGTIEVVG